VIEDLQVKGRSSMKMALSCALIAKNSAISRGGRSSHQLVFGRQCYLPELLDEEIWQATSRGHALSVEGRGMCWRK
jgi:hypothetical protein